MLPDDPKANIEPDIDLDDDEVEDELGLPAIEEEARRHARGRGRGDPALRQACARRRPASTA